MPSLQCDLSCLNMIRGAAPTGGRRLAPEHVNGKGASGVGSPISPMHPAWGQVSHFPYVQNGVGSPISPMCKEGLTMNEFTCLSGLCRHETDFGDELEESDEGHGKWET